MCPRAPCEPAKPWEKGQKLRNGGKAGGMERLFPGSLWSETNPKPSPVPRRTAQPIKGSAGASHFKPALWFLLLK